MNKIIDLPMYLAGEAVSTNQKCVCTIRMTNHSWELSPWELENI